MSEQTPDWISVPDAVKLVGCSEGLIRLRIRDKTVDGWKANERCWMVSRKDCMRLRERLIGDPNVPRRGRPAKVAAKSKATSRGKSRRKAG